MNGPEIKINRIVGPEDEPECVVSPIDDDQTTFYRDYVKAPWSVREVQNRDEIQFKILDNEEKIICQVTTKLKDQKYGKSIARLIAGAPRMVDKATKVHGALLLENDQPTILSHDFEGFNKELKRHGFWASDLQIMKKQLQQMELPFNEKPELKVVSG